MANVADPLSDRHAPVARVSAPHDLPAGLGWFRTGVVFLPVRAVSPGVNPPECGAELPGFDPAPPPGLFFAVDSRTRLGRERREIICERCVWGVLQDRGRDSDVVRCWYQHPAAEAPVPSPLGETPDRTDTLGPVPAPEAVPA